MTQENRSKIMLHGAMIYECETCGKLWRMWLECGVEGPGTYEDGTKLMPCPFTIKCACGGTAHHAYWGSDISLPKPRPLINPNTSYFKLDREGLANGNERACGIPIVNPKSRNLRVSFGLNGGGFA